MQAIDGISDACVETQLDAKSAELAVMLERLESSSRLMARIHASEVRYSQSRPQPVSLSSLRVVSLNAGGRMASEIRLSVWLQRYAFWYGVPDVIMVQELDGMPVSSRKVEVDGYYVYRRWPGAGSRSMAMIISHRIASLVCWRRWAGRCGCLLLGTKSGERLLVVNVHGPHSLTLMQECLTDVAMLVRSAPAGVPTVVCGDFNIDLLPAAEYDPWHDLHNRQQRHKDERAMLCALQEALNLEEQCALEVQGLPEGRWRELAAVVPFSRVPWSEEDDCEVRASLLDYALVRGVQVAKSAIDWRLLVADHAAVTLELGWIAQMPRRPKRCWKVAEGVSELMIAEAVVLKELEHEVSRPSLLRCATEIQSLSGCQRNVKMRHNDRIPFAAKVELKKMEALQCPRARKAAKSRAETILKKHVVQLRTSALAGKISEGQAIWKSKPLKTISSIKLGAASTLCTAKCMLPAVVGYFENKWGCSDLAGIEVLKSQWAALSGLSADYEDRDVLDAFSAIKMRNNLGSDGTCFAVWPVLFSAAPSEFVGYLNVHLCSPGLMSAWPVEAKLWGKKTSSPALEEIRAVLPLPPVLQVGDWLVARSLAEVVYREEPVAAENYEGGRRGTQPADIVAGLSLALEKSHDCGSPCAIAQADVRSFYDKIDLLLLSRWLLFHACPGWLVAAVLVMQLGCMIQFRFGEEVAALRQRCRGSLTGSRIAGICGQAIMRDVMRQCSRLSVPYSLGGKSFGIAVWVDNMYAIGASARLACERLQVCESILRMGMEARFKA